MNQETNFPRTNFRDKGYFIAKASNIQPLIDLQTFLVESIDSYKSTQEKISNEDLLNDFHIHYSSEESKLNDVRMKVMNEIQSEFNGEIVEILVEDGESVEYSQPLFKIRRG